MNDVMLDTSAYAAFKTGNEKALHTLQFATKILLPITVYGELLAGFEAGTRRDQNRQDLIAFIRTPRVHVVPTISKTAERYAKIYAYLRRVGKPVPTNDLWIAASTMEYGAELLTADSHFLHIPQIFVNFID